MSNTVKLPTCPKCQAPIPAEAPQGLCPKCVLLGAATATEQGVPATATSEIPSIERISKAFPQLEVLELIGRGGMGFVFKARQPHLDRFVALKLLPDKLAKDAQFAERFNREGRVLAKLNHPNIVSVFDFGQAGGFYYLSMEYVDGVNLRQAMRAGRFSPAEALSIVPKVCEALQYAHEQGILHRDIKPENILLDAKGRVKIADFGIAKLVGEDQPNITLTNTGAALGTPHYMAPEQLEKPATVDHRADIYSLGVVFYEMLTGELPIGRFAAPSAKTPVNTTVDDVVFRTLEKDRERRFQSAGEMRTQVEHLGLGAATEPSTHPHTEQEERRFSRWSIYGSISVGLSLPVPMSMLVAVLTGLGGIGPSEFWLALGSVALPGLGGTLLGWLGLNEIRESHGRVKGLPLAMFATLFWPLTILGALTIGVPMFLVVPSGEPSAARTIGRFLVLLLPAAVIAFGFWAIHATARWAGSQQVVQQRGILKWVFIVVLVVGMGVVLVTNPGQHRAGSQPPVQSGQSGALSVAKTNVVELSLFKNQRNSIFLTTASPLGPDEALVPILERPDGTRETGQFITHFSRENNRTQERATAIWNWERDRNFQIEEVQRIETLLEESVVGRPLTLVAGQPLHLFSLTNRAGGVLRCHLDYQPDFAETAYRSTESDQAMVRVERGIVSSGSSSTLIVWLKPSIPSGHSLQPVCDGTIGSSGTTQRTVSQGLGNASFTCNWTFPESFTSNDVFAAQAQCDTLRQSPPFAIPSGGRQLLFAVTNQAGEVHRGYLDLVKLDRSGMITNTSPPGMKTSSEGNTSGAVRQAAASAELWAPDPALVEQPKPYEILQEASLLAKEGQYEQALQRHLWYHHHALEFQPSQKGVRLSFALMQWMELARRYPKAKDALLEIRDQGAREFSDGSGSFTHFVEASFINKSLGEDHATVALFKTIQERNPKLARQCYQLVADLLVETGEYALSASFIPDVQQRFDQIYAKREKMWKEARNPKSAPDLLRKEGDGLFIKETRTFIEILVGTGRKSEAGDIRDQAVAVLDVPELRSAVADAEERVAKHSVVPNKL